MITARSHALVLALTLAFAALPAVQARGDATSHHVIIDGMKFTPDVVDAKVGDTVVWENKDIVPHTATSVAKEKGKAVFESGTIAGGTTHTLKLRKAGTFPYVCRFHPTMKGTIKVSH